MAVRFEQPQPLSPAISGAYGAALAQQQGGPLLQRQMESGTDSRLRAAQAQQARSQASSAQAMALAQRQTESDYQNATRSLIADGDTEQREADRDLARQGLESRLNVSARDVFQANAQAQLQQQEAQLKNWLSRQEMTDRDMMQYQQRKRALADLMQDPDLLPDEKMRGAAMIKHGLDIDEARIKNAQVKQMEQKTALYQQQAQMETQVRLKNAQLDAATIPERTVSVPLPDGGTATLFQTGYDANGRPTYTQAKAADSPQQKAQEAEIKAQEDYVKLRVDIMKQAMSIAGDVAKANADKAKESGGAAPQTDPEIVGHWTNRLLDEAGVGRTWDEQKRRIGMPGGGGGGGGQSAVGDSGAAPGGTAPQPYSRYEPKTQAQRAVVADFTAKHAELQARADLPQEEKAAIARALDEVMALQEKGKLTPEEQTRLDKLLRETRIPAPRTEPAASPEGTRWQKFGRGELVTTKDIFGS